MLISTCNNRFNHFKRRKGARRFGQASEEATAVDAGRRGRRSLRPESS